MALDLTKQIRRLVSESQQVLICLPREANIDSVLAGAVFSLLLKSQNKPHEIVCEKFSKHDSIGFVDFDFDSIQSSLPPLRQLVVTLDVSREPLGSLYYSVSNKNKLNIFITPKSGEYKKTEASVTQDSPTFDLVITIGATDHNSLGSYYKREVDFFTSTPTLNIDYVSENERFGTVNVVDTVASTNCEVVYHLVKKLHGKLIEQKTVSEMLLAGILSKTSGLTRAKTSTRLVETIKSLVDNGADMVTINTNLFYTKPISSFRLWGRVLARLQEDRKHGMVWSMVPYEDFAKTSTGTRELLPIIDEILMTYVHAKIVVLVWENSDRSVSGVIATDNQHNALDLVYNLNPEGKRDFARFSLPQQHINSAMELVVEQVRKRIEHVS